MSGGSDDCGLTRGIWSEREFDELLRRSLHAAAQSVEPDANGLDKIFAGLRQRSQPATVRRLHPVLWPPRLNVGPTTPGGVGS
jgi:hypothetical protein